MKTLIALIFFLLLSYCYLYPGGELLLEGNTTAVMSDGSDPAAAPFSYGALAKAARENPTMLLYGAFPTKQSNAPEGLAAWHPWTDKIAVSFLSPFVPDEQMTTALAWLYFFLDGICFYFLGQVLKWPTPISYFGGICWAFSAYTRGRAKVHMGLIALFFLPLGLIALVLLKKSKKEQERRNILVASGLLLTVALVPHYYIILTLFTSPFLIWYYLVGTADQVELRMRLKRLGVALLPAIVLLSWSFLKPAPAGYLQTSQLIPQTGVARDGNVHPFLDRFGLKPYDFLTGEIAIGLKDINPVRELISEYAVEHLDGSNTHEKSQGIRWIILIVALICSYKLFVQYRNKREWSTSRREMLPLFCLALFAFLMSLSPELLGYYGSPSYWLYKIVSQVRVTSRSGIFVSFALLLIAGNWLARLKRKKWLWILPLVAILELPPFLNAMPIARILPPHPSLQSQKACGIGMYFPYISGLWQLGDFYYFLQRMRGTNCGILNADQLNSREDRMLQLFPLHPDVLKLIVSVDSQLMDRTIGFVKCTQLSWIAFDPRVPDAWKSIMCLKLGWKLTEDDVCQASQHTVVERISPECLQ